MAVIKNLMPSGGSQSVIIPKPFLDQLNLDKDNPAIEMRMEGEAIIMTAHRYATAAEFKASTDRVFAKHGDVLKRLSKR
jgi:antitoxin component of MazEF toxin-antitoxin module